MRLFFGDISVLVWQSGCSLFGAYLVAFGITPVAFSEDTEAGLAANLQNIERLEILESSANEVEFKIYCSLGSMIRFV